MIKGIDVSHHQKNIDWQKVKNTGIEFVIIKATEGVDYVDDMFKSHYEGAKSVGLKVGVYHFATPSTVEDAKNEANDFLKAIGGLELDIAPVLDFEQSKGVNPYTLTRIALKWLWTVEEALKAKPIFYSYPAFIKTKVYADDLKDYPLWIAHYNTEKPNIKPWNEFKFWQHTSDGQVDGINGRVDMNYFNGTFEQPKEKESNRINDIQIAPNFKLYEFECHDGKHEVKVHPGLVDKLQKLRELTGPITINSGYRTHEYNMKIGGSAKSQHMRGYAADLKLPKGLTIDQFANLAEKVGFNGIGKYNWGIHVDVREEYARWDYR